MEEKKNNKIYKTIMLIVVVAIVTFVVTSIVNYDGTIRYVVTGQSSEDAELTEKIATALSTITDLLEEKYIGDIDEDELIDGALKGMVESVGDAYTTYYTEEELDEFTTSTLGNYVGIGVYLTADTENDTIVVIAPIEGSPAEEAGIQTGDQILAADGVEYSASELSELSDYIKGEEGTSVELTILRDGETFTVTVTRREVDIKYVDGTMLDDNIGYIAISTFDEDCADDFKEEYESLIEQGATSLIIDLRDNGGGLVDSALEIAELMCDKGDTLLITVDKDGNEETTKAKKDAEVTVPIVVLTNGNSASASEILAAALKDNDKATLVGKTTYGKGVIQELLYLSNGGALKVTTSEYFTPNGDKIDGVGISPDYEVDIDYSSDDDAQLAKAIEIIKDM